MTAASSRSRLSAGLVLYRRHGSPPRLQVLLAHMGGPLWARRDAGAWSIPKGEHTVAEDAYAAARREFAEETGHQPPDGDAVALGSVRQAGGKSVTAWAVAGDLDPATATSTTFTMEWPPRSGRLARFPEVDRVAWFDLDAARVALVRAQAAFVDRLEAVLDDPDGGTPVAAD